jgi:ribosomal protein L11 methyltransferase
MPTYSLSCTVDQQTRELLLGSWYGVGMLGCQEKERSGGCEITAYFADHRTAQAARSALKTLADDVPVDESVVEDEDWNAKWRQSMKPARLAPGFWVSPTWLRPDVLPGECWIKIEPKMAFGTGHHETTRLAAHGIVRRTSAGPIPDRLLDIGTGSGVLCFVADRRGVPHCIGIDTDAVCRGNLVENLRDNTPRGRVDFLISTIECLSKGAPFGLVAMNMIFNDSAPLLGRIAELLDDRGMLVWSGILVDGRQEAVGAATAHGFVLAEEMSENEWWCGVFSKG